MPNKRSGSKATGGKPAKGLKTNATTTIDVDYDNKFPTTLDDHQQVIRGLSDDRNLFNNRTPTTRKTS
jgi:hypothetical protein